MTFLLIFTTKVIENSLSTLRLIVIANGKKLLGAILNFFVAITWVISTSLVVQNFKDIISILAFSLGCFTGSFLGSLIENKLGLGSNLLMVISNNHKKIKDKLKDICICYNIENVIFVLIERKKISKILKTIYDIDTKTIIISEVAKNLSYKLSKVHQ